MTEDIIFEFGYDFSFEMLELPRVTLESSSIQALQAELIQKLPNISLNSEIARRDFLVAPILFKLLNFLNIKIKTEYPLDVARNLKGVVYYLIHAETSLTVIEAKKSDLEKGFTQLAVELIALAQQEESNKPLFGIVTTGDIWKFGKLEGKRITKDINNYRVPSDLYELFTILVGILK